MEKIRKIEICPNCAADVRSIDPNSLTENKCPYCGFELYNHSEQIYEKKYDDVKKAKSRLIRVQIAIAVAALALVAAGIIYVANRTVYRSSDEYFIDQSDKMTKQLHKAYVKEDWDKLFDLVILNADQALSSPYYFSYRAAWMMSEYVPIFDEAIENGDKDNAQKYYKEIKNEYEYREKLAELYKLVPEIEEKLEKEYLREEEIMQTKGWI